MRNPKLEKYLNWENLLTLFAIALPLGSGLFNSAFGLIMGYWVFGLFTRRVQLGRRDLYFLIAVCSYYGYAVLRLAYSANISYGLDKIYSQSFLVFFPLVFLSFKNEIDESTFLKVIKGFLLSLTGVSVASVAKQAYGILSGAVGFDALTQNNLSTAVVDNYFLGLSLLIAFGLSAYTYLKLFKTTPSFFRFKGLEFAVVTSLSVTLILLNSRSLILITAFIVCLLFLVKSILDKKPGRFLKMVLAMVAAISLNYWANPYFGNKMAEVVNYSEEGSRDKYWGGMRESIWDCTFKVIGSEPVLGVGVGDQKDQLELCYGIYMHNRLFANNSSFNAHNIFLQTMLATGIVGLFLFLFSLGYMIRLAKDSDNMYFMVFITVFVLAGLTESYFERNLTMCFFAFFNCLSFFSKSKPIR